MARKPDSFTTRFAFGGPGESRSAVWRVWAPRAERGKSDVYLAARLAAGEFKISFHESGQCLEGATSELARRRPELLAGSSRTKAQWTRRLRSTTNLRDTFRLVVPAFALRRESPDKSVTADVSWLPAPAQGQLGIVRLVFVDTGFLSFSAFAASAGAQGFTRWQLPNGETLVLIASTQAISADFLRAYETISRIYERKLAEDAKKVGDPQMRIAADFAMDDGVRAMLDLPYPLPKPTDS